MKLPGWLTPWRKMTDLNTVTPIRAPYTLQTSAGTIMEAFGGAWQQNLRIDSTRDILAFSAVYSCLSLIAGDAAKLGIKLKRLQESGIWTETTNPAYSPVLRRPNRYQTRIQFIEQWLLCKLIYGNTYVLKERDNRKVVTGLYILDPAGTLPLVANDGEVYYQIQGNRLAGVEASIVPASEILHDRARCLFHPLVGVAPLYACAMSATHGNEIQRNSSKFFGNMSRPSGQLTAPGIIDNPTAERLKREFEQGFSGANLGRLFVSGSGLKFEPINIPAEQAQLIEQLQFTVEDVARAYGVPLYKIQAGSNPTFNNIGALNLEYYQQALQPHIESIEALLDDGLSLSADLMVEFDLDGLLRMDPKTRFETYEIGTRAGILKPNEARRAENLEPVEGGDTPYLQQQNYALAALAKRDASDDPFGTAKPAATAPAPAPAPVKGLDDEDISAEDLARAESVYKTIIAKAGAVHA